MNASDIAQWVERIYHQPASRAIFLLAFFQIALGLIQSGFQDVDNPSRQARPDNSTLAIVSGIKVAVSLAFERFMATPWHIQADFGSPRATLGKLQISMLLALSVLYFVTTSLNPTPFAEPRTVRILDLSLVAFTGLFSALLVDQPSSSQQYTNIILQMTAVVLGEQFVAFKGYNPATYSFLLLSNLFSAFALISTAFVYQINSRISTHRMSAVLFCGTFTLYSVSLLFANNASPKPIPSGFRDQIAAGVVLFLRAARDLAGITVLQYSSPLAFCVTTLFSSSMVPPVSFLVFGASNGFDLIKWIVVVLAVYAALSYVLASEKDDHHLTEDQASMSAIPRHWPSRSAFAVSLLVLLPLLISLWSAPLVRLSWPKNHVWRGSLLGPDPLMPHQSQVETPGKCVRNPLPPTSAWVGPGERPDDFHAFDNVLLVVFFSHARYDVNIDGYREVYSRYFPNILFLGPSSREDRGFLHSYDVVVDSYKGEEDFSAGWYKMAGRVAHHMLYTAVKDHPCYDGYLWAPADALLNVARLAQYPQDHIWYHSPFGKHQPNPAFEDDAKILHAPAAEISTQTPDEYEKEQSAWGVKWKGWFWERHQGLKACMPAYEKMPARMRERLTGLTGGPEKFFLGSADTAYIPGGLRKDLLDVLGTFLQTDCFLEIVIPTALHLILPATQEIVFVDHFWSNNPPFDVSFIRDKWAKGYEVDSFHTFHWGDIHADGVWGANENSVDEARALLNESFVRQKMTVPKSP